jgi:uncharacterized protein YrrD
MLQSVKDLTGCELVSPDGALGTVREVYFDDRQWVVRHLVVDTGGWLSGKQVLISPHAVKTLDSPHRQLHVSLSRQQVEAAPGLETDRPVSRQYEAAAYDHYGYPPYWGGSGLWGMLDMPLGGTIAPYTMPAEPGATTAAAREQAAAEHATADPHLRSSAEVTGYDAGARDGDIGHVHDFLFDPDSWQLQLVVVDTHNWLPDRLVLVPPSWVSQVDATERRVGLRVSRQAVKDSPPYTARHAVDRAEALRVQHHFEGSE